MYPNFDTITNNPEGLKNYQIGYAAYKSLPSFINDNFKEGLSNEETESVALFNAINEDLSEYPMAAGIPESGTATTTSASILCSLYNCSPAFTLVSCTSRPSIIESGLAKYIYSNAQVWH